MALTIVILGAGWTGLPLAHRLLKYTSPKASIKIILVTPSSHFFWNVAATRGVIPGEIPDDQLFYPIEAQFQQYSTDVFELVLGSARSIDDAANTVHIDLNNGEARDLHYDQLVIATGSRLKSNVPLKLVGDYKASKQLFNTLQEKVGRANDIVIAGSGATGCEVAGELAAKYGKEKRITLIISGKSPLANQPGIIDSVKTTIVNDLRKLNVTLIFNKRVEESQDADTKTVVSLSDGSQITTDLYLPLFGIQLNTEFVPTTFLDDANNIRLDETHQVSGTKNIWALGDVGNLHSKQITSTDGQIIYLASVLEQVALAKTELSPKPYKPSDKPMVFVAMGRKYATGQIGGWRLPGWAVSYPKGRKLFVDSAAGYVAGKKLRHESM
ncbi:hypothetical protein VHEMI09262 [[Torrubiella] hemipterigena]|uniref:FAD/NAD(P)-binding domain-containing protein n=1 Tax=[Torrubiella] hemipterigena TaxID=1531966 RepID=A0A0A1TG05_9HYPO|nr:hypothetical protein VHEMI09262 [[Torrubiella] hemipterigena]